MCWQQFSDINAINCNPNWVCRGRLTKVTWSPVITDLLSASKYRVHKYSSNNPLTTLTPNPLEMSASGPLHGCARPLKTFSIHDDVTKWKHFPRYWPFVRGIHRSPVNSPHKGQWRGALVFSLICGWINGWINKRETGDLRRQRAHYDATVMNYHKLGLVQSTFALNDPREGLANHLSSDRGTFLPVFERQLAIW